MSTYLGNSSLSAAVKDRVSSTFQQTLTLYKEGRIEEVVQGCNLILQMDAMFDPARKLLEKARNPSAPIDVEALSANSDNALEEAREALASRDFSRAIQITTEILTNDLTNDDARVLNDQARERMEAAPFVEQFVTACHEHVAAGNIEAARADLEKARALDPDHPSIVEMESAIAAAPEASAPAGFGFEAPAFGFGQASPAAPSGFGFSNPSFVVDTPAPPTGRGTAQAADFGFTFEEERAQAPSQPAPPPVAAPTPPPSAPSEPAGFSSFSFDTPSSGADAPIGGFSFDSQSSSQAAAGSGFDFSTASIETSEDDRKKIDQYLAEGDRAVEAGDHQKAIDLWSRVFLIDVTNEQASERIEKAKAKRREIEQQAESLLAPAIKAYDQKDHATAREKFNEVLLVDPYNATARDYLDRMTETITDEGAAATEMPFTPPPAQFEVFEEDGAAAGETSRAPVAGRAAPAGAKKAKTPAAAAARRLPLGAVAALLGVLVLAGGGWFVWSRFLNKPDYDPVATQAILTRAGALGQQGKYDQAIAALREIKPDDPQHDNALVMIGDLQRKKAQASEMVDGKPAAVFFQERLAAATTAFGGRDFDAAKKEFEQAMRARPQLPPDAKAMYDTAAQQVAKLDSAKALFAERRYQDALTNLQTLQQQDPGNKSIERMILDAHFNLGALALQEERLPEAISAFDEVLKVNPEDELARRSKELASRYQSQQRDLLYKIYVKYLPLRPVT